MEVLKTKDYNKFGFLDENRDVNKLHVLKLEASMEEHGFWAHCPIEVDENYNILDGQHRFYAARELEIDVCFCFVHNTDGYIKTKNSLQNSWDYPAYLNYFIKRGNVNYIMFKDFIDEFGLTISMGRKLFKVQGRSFKNENMIITKAKVDVARDATNKAKEIMNIIKISDTPIFGALIIMIADKNYVHKKMISSATRRASHIRTASSIGRYIEQLQGVYNQHVVFEKKVIFRRGGI